MKIFYVQILIYIHFSLQQNNDIKETNLDKAVSNITELLKKKLINLSSQINNMINNTLNAQEQLFKNADSEKKLMRSMLKEIKTLKKRYKRNMIFSYVIGTIILFTFFVFYCCDNINKRKANKMKGYKNPSQTENENTQLDIDE